MSALKAHALSFIGLIVMATLTLSCYAHGVGPWVQVLDWRNDQIDQVIAFGGDGHKLSIGGRECLVGGHLLLRVNDEYAFDIDETVWLELEFYLGTADSKVSVSYDRNGSAPLADGTTPLTRGEHESLQLPQGMNGQWSRQSISLEHARFANLGLEGSDLALAAVVPMNEVGKGLTQFTVCNISLRRSYTTSIHKVFGWASIEVNDEHSQPTPARMGIYDKAENLLLPSDEAIKLRNGLTGETRVLGLGQGLPPWPVKNRSVFYSDGRYHTRLPVGEYEVIAGKGPEYRTVRQRFAVKPNETISIKIEMRRWADMTAKGWYSGEDHIHYARNSEQDDYVLQLFTRAEDLKVANILQFDNSEDTHFPHYDWKPVGSDARSPFVLVPGQEAPRTTRLGHTIQLNINGPIRDTAHYLLYHKVFERVHAQGGLAGYAHVTDVLDEHLMVTRGLAIDVPFGLVDFAEIMSFNWTGTSTWFDFLNLGYKLSPTAGTDYPFGRVPGTFRNYVHVKDNFSAQSWFDALKEGRTFVTSGPMLELSVNGQGMGSEVRVRSGESLSIKARGSLNPDFDTMTSLELIEQGEVVKEISSPVGAPELELRYDLAAEHGTWFVVRARGKNPEVVAWSGAIYVSVDGTSFWKRSEVPSIAAKMKKRMQEVFTPKQTEWGTEVWAAQGAFTRYWDAQHGALKERIEQANSKYDELVRRATTSDSQLTDGGRR